jgi:hypothetical protein
MAILRLVSIICDRCAATFSVSRPDPREVRVLAYRNGWRHLRTTGQDYCRSCAPVTAELET